MLQFAAPQSTLDRLITRTVDAPLSVPQHNTLSKAALSYLMHLTSFKQMQAEVKPLKLTPHTMHVLRQDIIGNYATVLGLKMVILIYLWRKQHSKPVNLQQLLRQAELPYEDESIVENLAAMQLQQAALKQLRRVKEKPLLMPNKVRDNCAQELKRLGPTIRNRVRSRLDFIAKSNNMPLYDLEDELRALAARCYYLVTPFRTDLHRRNIIIQTIYNESEKLRCNYHAQKRRRMDGDGFGGYQNVVHSLYHSQENELERNDVFYSNWVSQGENNFAVNWVDTQCSIENFVRKGPIGRQRIVNLLLLKPEPQFMQFLSQKRRGRKVKSLEEFYHRVGREHYNTLLSEYLYVPTETLDYLVAELTKVVCH